MSRKERRKSQTSLQDWYFIALSSTVFCRFPLFQALIKKIKGSEFKTTPPSDCVHAPPRSASTSMHCHTAISCSCALAHIRERWVFIHVCNQSYVLVMQEVEYPSSEVHYLHSTSKPAPTPPFFHPKAKEGSITYFSLLWGNSTAVSSDDRGRQRVCMCAYLNVMFYVHQW